ncbi:MAG: class I SAM-dependent methyltransferase [Bacteriovoracaceae bacterium]|nr:class I SAM-dependent methyltransferase [Bacteriovoracaceae bacterium]
MLPRCQLHPISIKLMRQGHPWVTLDAFSRRFPKEAKFVVGQDDRRMDIGVLLHDPNHKVVRGRLWSLTRPWDEKMFWNEVEQRLATARHVRLEIPSFKVRENRYWVFGEADNLPGLMLLQLGEHFIVQFYALCWREMFKELKPKLMKYFPEIKEEKLWIQTRSEDGSGQKPPTLWSGEAKIENFVVDEDGFKIIARLGEAYDYGVYSDMASVRYGLKNDLKDKKKVLNLYSYTGAFSLQALHLGADSVVSVDLSGKYLGWLDENIAKNNFKGEHRSLKMPVEEALKLLKSEGHQFDVIISDPPSASSDGNKRTSALKAYENQWQDLQDLLAPKGWLLSFLNTHTVSAAKFEAHLKSLPGNRLKISKRVGLKDDCPTFKGFQEGNYLKGCMWV